MRQTNHIVGLIALLLIATAGIGYVSNVVRLVTSDFEAPYKNEATRIVGALLPPVGMVVGYINIDDTPDK